MTKPYLAIDFDGTLAEYTEWKGPSVVGEPIPGALEFLRALSQKFILVIFSARASDEIGKKAIHNWIRRFNLRHIIYDVTNEKRYNYKYIIDDRAICFREANDYKLIARGLECPISDEISKTLLSGLNSNESKS